MPTRSTYLYVMFTGLLTLGIAVGSGHTSAELPVRPSTVTSGRSRTDVDKPPRKLIGSRLVTVVLALFTSSILSSPLAATTCCN